MALVAGIPNSLITSPHLPSTSMTPSERAHERFSLGGNAIVTGGAGELGFAVSRALLEHGVQGLMLFDVSPSIMEAKVSMLSAEFPGVEIRSKVVDTTDEAAVDAAVAETVSLLGPVTTLLNFAGTDCRDSGLNWTTRGWSRAKNVSTTGGFFVARAVARHMIVHKTRGSIVFLASIAADQRDIHQPQMPYNGSKCGVKAMVRSLAGEWARYGIRVNSISPGYLDTVLDDGDALGTRKSQLDSPFGQTSQPDGLCGAAVMLASRAGSYFNGSDLLVDGGQTLSM